MDRIGIEELSSLRAAAQICLFLLLLYSIPWVIYTRYFHPLSGIPGPFWASISRVWLAKQAAGGKLEQVVRNLHKELGPLVRTAPNEVTISDPEAMRIIYGSKPTFRKTDFYTSFGVHGLSPNGDLFTMMDDQFHDERRKIVSGHYSMSSILEQEEYIDSCSNLFNQRMGEFAERQETVDLGEWIHMYAFDVIGELHFGKKFGFMEERVDYGNYMESLWNMLSVLAWVIMLPSFAQKAVLAGGFVIPSVRRGMTVMLKIMKLAKQRVAERQRDIKQGKPTRQDLMAKSLAIHQERGEKENFLLEDTEMESYDALVAGSDTTAIAIRSIIYRILKTPTVYQKLLDEFDKADRAGQLSRPNVRYVEAIKLPYFVACCKEGMRLHPPISFPLPRHIPAGGKEIAGKFIPQGYRVGMSSGTLHYDTEIFGLDADAFNPERWLGDSAQNMDRYMFHFGYGNRNCIGRNIALAEMYKLLPQLLMEYRLELEDPNLEWKTLNFWFHKQTGIKVRVSKRW
ncbi:hypothetical protein MMC29_001821 [Sticta canariensis]|nr:hypothetical protein [Sticta canariensis]